MGVMHRPPGTPQGARAIGPAPDCPCAPRFYLSYVAYQKDAWERTRRGQEQQVCGTCLCYRWPDQCAACPSFTAHTCTP